MLDVKADLLAFVQGVDASALYRGNVHKDILRPIVGLDEAKPLLGVKPLDYSLCHSISSPTKTASYPKYHTRQCRE